MPVKNILSLLLILFLFACVPARKYQDLKDDYYATQEENEKCEEKLTELLESNEKLKEDIKNQKKIIAALQQDTMHYHQQYNKLKKLNENLNALYEKVIQQNKDLLSTSTTENQRLSMELENKRRELEMKEKQLEIKEQDIGALQKDLEEREKRVRELESLIHKKDSAVNSLKTKVNKALLGFADDELTVEMKNGKVYVSLSEQLLFKSGSTTVDPKGKDALAKLSDVLKKNPDINILIEGHTDNVPLKGGNCMKDNWDLSVLRATSIVRILTTNEVNPERILAAGKSKFQPVATNETAEGRQKNRRTEIILTPKLDELFKILEVQ